MPIWIWVVPAFSVPLVCWLLLTRTKVMGWTFGTLVAVFAIEQGLVADLASGMRRFWLVVMLGVLSVIALVVGNKIESHLLKQPKRIWTAHARFGEVLAVGYAIVVVGLIALGLVAEANEVRVPSSGYVLPLGPGLRVTSQKTSCGGGSGYYCDRFIRVAGPTGSSAQVTLMQVRDRVASRTGWHLAADQYGGWTNCPDDDGTAALPPVCVEITADDRGGVDIDLEAGVQSS